MTTYKAAVRNKDTNEISTIESDYPTLEAFKSDLRANEYAVIRAQRKDVYDYNVSNAKDEDDWLTANEYDAL